MLGNRGIIRFRAQGIQFPENFLGNEFERAADWLVLAQMMRKLREVAFQPGQFFRDVRPIGEKGYFLQQAFVLDREIETRLFDPLEQGPSISFYDVRI